MNISNERKVIYEEDEIIPTNSNKNDDSIKKSNFEYKEINEDSNNSNYYKNNIINKDKRQRLIRARDLYFENEAESGSENEDNNEFYIKNKRVLDSEDEYDKELELKELNNENEDLEDLIDKDYYKNLDLKKVEKEDLRLYKKYFDEALKEDKLLIKKIINFDHNKRKNKNFNKELEESEMSEEGYIPINERKRITEKDLNNSNKQDNIKFRIQLLTHLDNKKKRKKNFNELKNKNNEVNNNNNNNKLIEENNNDNNNSDCEEAERILQLRKEALIKKCAKESSIYKEEFNRIVKQNEFILKNNCINLNQVLEEQIKEEKERKKNNYFDNSDEIKKYKNNNLVRAGGMFYSKTNSFLHKKLSKDESFFSNSIHNLKSEENFKLKINDLANNNKFSSIKSDSLVNSKYDMLFKKSFDKDFDYNCKNRFGCISEKQQTDSKNSNGFNISSSFKIDEFNKPKNCSLSSLWKNNINANNIIKTQYINEMETPSKYKNSKLMNLFNNDKVI